MDREETAEGLAAQGAERRSGQRHAVDDDATMLLVGDGRVLQCRVLDLSVGGCRLRTRAHFKAGPEVRVEVAFRVNGLAFRLCGVTQWTNEWNVVGVQFVDVPQRRMRDLAEVVDEVSAEAAARETLLAQEPPTEESAEDQAADQAIEGGGEAGSEQAPEHIWIHAVEDRPVRPIAAAVSEERPAAGPRDRERRAQPRLEVDTSAAICLIHTGSRLNGRILDLSLDGCRIRTDAPFQVGIYTRIEVEFRLQGTPFRVGGVLQAIHEKRAAGIRFLDVSERKRGQLEQLIGDLEDPAGPGLTEAT
jgi:c-di-GMP-binding flagellar brake protein YcgR